MKASWVAVAVCCFTSSACAPYNNSGESNGNTSSAPIAPVVRATGWDEIEMLANYANTSVDSSGHFSTSYNRCYHEGSGALTADIWNDVAAAVNASVQNPPSAPAPDSTGDSNASTSQEVCAQLDSNYNSATPSYLKAKLPNGKSLTLIENRGNQMCSNVIKDASTITKLVNALDKVAVAAANEDCAQALRTTVRNSRRLDDPVEPEPASVHPDQNTPPLPPPHPSPVVEDGKKEKGKKAHHEFKQKQEY